MRANRNPVRAALALAVIVTGAWRAAAEPYAWPLDTPRLITSSFGEYRSFRFHAGIDLRAATGTPVRAADDGAVSRVRVSPYGYGKAVYLRLADGNTAVYAHLDRFNPAIEAFVRAEQHRRESYTVDRYPGEGALPVTRGEIIAYTGSTGSGPPHLHYELRDPNNVVINPRTLGIAWPDTTRPIVTGLAIVPRGPGSRVNGNPVPLVLAPDHTGGGTYTVDPVAVAGPIGLAVAKHDPANEGANRLGIHTLEVQRRGETVFRMVNDRLDYDTMHHGAVAWHPYLLGEGRFLTAYRAPGNNAPPYRVWRGGDGFFTVPVLGAEVELILTDFLGNTSRVQIPMTAALETPAFPPAPTAATPRVTLDVFGDWLSASLTFESPLEAPPAVIIQREGRPLGTALEATQTAANAYRVGVDGTALSPGLHELALVRPDGTATGIASFAAVPRGQGTQTVRVGDAAVLAGPQAGFGTLLLDVSARPTAISGAPVPAHGQAYPLGHPNTPIDTAVTVRLPLPGSVANPARAAIYRRVGSSWSHLTTRRDGAYLEATTRRLGTFAVLEDTAAPVIRDLEPADGATVSGRRPAIRARVSDVGSGIADIRVTVGGQWLLTAYTPDEDRIHWMQDRDLPSGTHPLVVTVTDRAGNATTVTRTITVP